MATVTGVGQIDNRGVWRHTWADMTNGDTGAPSRSAGYPDKTFQVTGTFGAGGQCDIEGSNDGTNYFVLSDPQGNAASLTAAGLVTVVENVEYVRPSISSGDGTTELSAVGIAAARV